MNNTLKDITLKVMEQGMPVWFLLTLATLVVMIRILHEGHFKRLKLLCPPLYMGVLALAIYVFGKRLGTENPLGYVSAVISTLFAFGGCCGIVMAVVTSKSHAEDL